MRSDKIYLEHILDCIERIEQDTRAGKSAFLGSHTQQDAVLRNLQILTESSQRLSEDQKRDHPEVEWGRWQLSATSLFMIISESIWNRSG